MNQWGDVEQKHDADCKGEHLAFVVHNKYKIQFR